MDGNRMPVVTLRLRQLSAVYGRNFRFVADDRDTSGDLVTFAISPIDPGHLGYVFVSDPCHNVNNPEWDPIQISDCSNWMLSAKAALFTFFSVKDDVNTIVFEIEVHFSGLVMLPNEIQDTQNIVASSNQVFFRMGNNLYAPPNYLIRDESGNTIRSPLFRLNPKPSYDFVTLQQFLVNDEIMKTQHDQSMLLHRSMCMLREYLRTDLFYSAERETKQAEVTILRRRLCTLRASVLESRNSLRSVAEQRSRTDGDLDTLRRANKTVTQRCEMVNQLIQKRRIRLSAVEKALSFRARQLIQEITELFGAELGRIEPKCTIGWTMSQTLSKNKHSAQSHESHPDPRSLPAQSETRTTDQAMRSVPEQLTPNFLPNGQPAINDTNGVTGGVMDGLICKLWGNHVSPTPDGDAEPAAVGLGLVAHLLRLISAILNQPLRYPLDMSEGFSRSVIIDQVSTDLSDTARVFPLYLPRSSLVPAYKHAIALLNRNLVALRSLEGLPTPTEQTTIWNLRTLLQHCLSNP